MVRLEKVEKFYGRGRKRITALSEASLEVGPGEFVVITGPSGSGKTTLLNLIGGMTRPSGGKVFFEGRDLEKLSDKELSRLRAEKIGFVFQFQSMLPVLSALDNVRLPLIFSSSSQGDEGSGRARQLLAEMGLQGREEAFLHELSAGQQRRVCIARALINRPALLLCDEPTGDLDPETEQAIMNLIAKANREGATVVMTTHNHSLKKWGTRRLKIEQGRLSEE